MNIILIILVFGVIVFFHELGHFLVAKLNHITVNEFAIGMGPCIFSFEKKGTKYSLRLLPLGGFCLMMDEEDNPDDENAFNNKPVWVRMLVIAAGPFFNFLLAFIFGIVLIHYTGCDPAIIHSVSEGGAAYEAGVTDNDTILKINGKRIYNYRELQLYMELNDSSKPVTLLMETEEGRKYETTITPRVGEDGKYRLGVGGGYVVSGGLGDDIKYGALELRYWVKATISSLKMIVTGQVKSDEVLGPVGVGNAMNDIIEEAKTQSSTIGEKIANVLLNLMNWCILLSVNLGVMNLLPIPALDGGRLLLFVVEAIRRKKIPQEKEAIVNLIGFVILIGIMVCVFFNDIKNVFIK